MRDYLTIGSSPAEESCAQVGTDNYLTRSRKECEVFIRYLRRIFGPEPEGAKLYVKSFPHDFGSYLEVCCSYEDSIPAAAEYAYKLEGESPGNWDEEALKELNQ
jgi:hypothetical protein